MSGMDDDLEGLEIPGYDLEEVIGHGGFGMVVRAHQRGFDRNVAIKIGYRPLRDADAQRRFDRECRTLGSLSGHPHIVGVTAAGQLPDGRPWLAMEHHPGGSLADVVERQGPLPWPEAREIGVKLARALQAAHDAGILHRDVKPDNVLMSRWGEPVLADFGIARFATDELTATTNVTASVGYAPPEVLSGQPATPAADVYSLGATLAGAMMGHAPFETGEEQVLAARIARIITAPVPDLRPRGVPLEGAQVIAWAMNKEPGSRPVSMQAFREALEATPETTGGPPAAVPPVPPVIPEPPAGVPGPPGPPSPGTSGPIPPTPVHGDPAHPPPPPPAPGAPPPPLPPDHVPEGGALGGAGEPTPAAGSSGATEPSVEVPTAARPRRALTVVAVVAGVLVVAGLVVSVALLLQGRDEAQPPPTTETTTTGVPPFRPADALVSQTDLPRGFIQGTIDGSLNADFACGQPTGAPGPAREASANYVQGDVVDLLSIAGRFADEDAAAAWMDALAELPESCESWDFEADDGTTITFVAETASRGELGDGADHVHQVVGEDTGDAALERAEVGGDVHAVRVGDRVAVIVMLATEPRDPAIAQDAIELMLGRLGEGT